MPVPRLGGKKDGCQNQIRLRDEKTSSEVSLLAEGGAKIYFQL